MPSRSPRRALCLAGNRRGPRASPLGSQPHRRLSGDCSRVLTDIRRVKPSGDDAGSVEPAEEPDHHPQPCDAADGGGQPTLDPTARSRIEPPIELHWFHTRPVMLQQYDSSPTNPAERLALAPKTVSFGQCRFRLERRPTTKRGWRTGFLPRQPMLDVSSAGPARCRRRTVPRRRASCPHLWITVWTGCQRQPIVVLRFGTRGICR